MAKDNLHPMPLLGIPRLNRRDLLRFVEPRLDTGNFQNWVARGFFETQLAAGNAAMLRTTSEAMEKNEARGSRRLWTGLDLLRVAILHTLSRSGLPLTLLEDIELAAMRRVGAMLDDGTLAEEPGPDEHAILLIHQDASDQWVVELASLSDCGSPLADDKFAVTVLDLDRLVRRVIEKLIDDE